MYLLDSLQTKERKYYVYRFLNKYNVITYVGRTVDLYKRFLQHDHLTDEVSKIEYIECDSEAEMAWKEVYYINLYYNELSTNISDVYLGGQMKDIGLDDKWRRYKYQYQPEIKDIGTLEKYNKYVVNIPNYDYKSLIHIIDHQKLNEIGKDKYAITQKWFNDHRYDGLVDKLRRSIMNFFRNLTPNGNSNSTHNNLWTTYDEYREEIKGKGFGRAFVNLNYDTDKDYSDRIYLAYIANNFYPATMQNNYEITENQYALTKLLQFMFKSALSKGNEIWIYIPSKRMRNLLNSWIENDLK